MSPDPMTAEYRRSRGWQPDPGPPVGDRVMDTDLAAAVREVIRGPMAFVPGALAIADHVVAALLGAGVLTPTSRLEQVGWDNPADWPVPWVRLIHVPPPQKPKPVYRLRGDQE